MQFSSATEMQTSKFTSVFQNISYKMYTKSFGDVFIIFSILSTPLLLSKFCTFFPIFPKIIISFPQVHLTANGSNFLQPFSVALWSKVPTKGNSSTMVESSDYKKQPHQDKKFRFRTFEHGATITVQKTWCVIRTTVKVPLQNFRLWCDQMPLLRGPFKK